MSLPGQEEKLTDGLDAIHSETAENRKGTQGVRGGTRTQWSRNCELKLPLDLPLSSALGGI